MFEVDSALSFPVPDGFHVMDESEMKGLLFYNNSKGKCISDPELHVVISVGCKPVGALLALLIDSKDVAKRIEASIRKPMLAYG